MQLWKDTRLSCQEKKNYLEIQTLSQEYLKGTIIRLWRLHYSPISHVGSLRQCASVLGCSPALKLPLPLPHIVSHGKPAADWWLPSVLQLLLIFPL